MKILNVDQFLYELKMYNKFKNNKNSKKRTISEKYFHDLYESYASVSFEKTKRAMNIAHKLDLRRTDHLLDAGCGNGSDAAELIDSVKSVVCIDINDKELNKARSNSKLAGSRILNTSIHSIDFDDSIFDKVLCAYVFPMFKSYSEVEKGLSELIRVTDHKGLVLIQAATYLHFNDSVEQYQKFYAKLLKNKGIENYWFIRDCRDIEDTDNKRKVSHDLLFQVRKWPKAHKVFV